MCELLGLCFSQPVSPSISFRGFRHRGENNPHGWGIAFYPDRSAQVIKEPVRAGESKLSQFLQEYDQLQSQIFIAHVRYMSRGEKSHANTHPFIRELGGKEYVFAHNGTIDHRSLRLGRFQPVGNTDSEHLFCHLLARFEEQGISKWDEASFQWLTEVLHETNNKGKMNLLFSEGKFLFCYRCQFGHTSLQFVRREAPFPRIRLQDEDWEINLEEEKSPDQAGYVVATRKLTNERWKNFEKGELCVFLDGEIVFSSSGREEGEKGEIDEIID
ncbi:MAG: class II glutamine amidotransferase [Deltaproteobacteria bacterium]|nr:MAG: class II glutamine amidotransferase [Deltaproteobacteria bacterium]